MVDPKKNTPAEDLIASLLKEVGEDLDALSNDENSEENHGHEVHENPEGLFGLVGDSSQVCTPINTEESFVSTQNAYESTRSEDVEGLHAGFSLFDEVVRQPFDQSPEKVSARGPENLPNEATVALQPQQVDVADKIFESTAGDSEKTVAVTGFQIKNDLDYDDKIKVSVGQSRPGAFSTGYAAWGSNSESNLAQAENLRMAQDKILELERENEQLRQQNDQMISASEIIKERSDLLTGQVTEFKNDREGLEESFKNETTLLKNHLVRKEAELQRAQFKVDELESRLKFDMKKIRIRERELENRLELVRAEKNAIVKNKDEQILDLRRKMDIVQMEVDSYRQKCVELNKLVEINQESFKRTTRALRLAMANLELQDENKVPLKKVD
ncbi:MAG: hypothetical protein H7328_03830 [Bdellovibrio sp.]|nr:hypothetical protein [Bdellovibrio sp.]